jgi:Asp-tRNA(Asn)/Glu-tRNA(Gln) amidotransferase A subunit family amidase
MSKADILQSIRENIPVYPATPYDFTEQTPLPTAAEALEQFKKSLKTAGAEVVELKEAEVDAYSVANWPGVLDFTLPEVIAEYPASCSCST